MTQEKAGSFDPWLNVYGRAMSDSKRDANSKVVEMILKPRKSEEEEAGETSLAATGS